MCEKCERLDAKIDRYKYLAGRITDVQTLAGISLLILKCENEKRALHPKSNGSR
jgi:hypothetical protein